MTERRATALARRRGKNKSLAKRSVPRPPGGEAAYAHLIEQLPLGLVVWRFDDLDNPATLRMVACNEASARISNILPEQAVGRLFTEVRPDFMKSGLPQIYAQVARTGRARTIDDFFYSDAHRGPAFFRIHVFPLAGGQVGIAYEDVTPRKQAEEMVRQIADALAPITGEGYFRALVLRLSQACHADMALIGFRDATDAGRVRTLAVTREGQYVDNLVFELAGTAAEQLAGGEVLHVEHGARGRFPRDALLARWNVDSYLGMELSSSTGQAIGLIAVLGCQPLPQADQAKLLLRVVAPRAAAELDRQLSEQALRASKEFLQLSQRAGNVGSWQWDLRTNAVQWSDSMFALYGIAPADFDGTLASATRTTFPDDIPVMQHAIEQTIRDGVGIGFEYRVLRDTGGISYLWSQSYVVADADGQPTHVIGTVVDMTARHEAEDERKKLESQFQQTQKLESLGVLAGGIAHDFNNILTGLLGYANLALHDLPTGSTSHGFVAETVKAAQRAAELTKQMLAYSGRGHFVIGPTKLNALIEDLAPLIQVSMSKKCSLSLQLAPGQPTIEADAVQIRQIIMNLVINASEAVGDQSGLIRVETGVRSCDSAFLSTLLLGKHLPEGDYAYLQVADTGSGMSEETRAKIFDPFFTTKFTGRGLGLAAVLGIVRGHQGAISVQSEAGRGTTFTIVFPISHGKEGAPAPESAGELEWRASGTALVIDDDDVIRKLAELMLQRMGFAVLTAADGREGVEVFGRHAREIRLVLLDMTMPNLDGEETFAALRDIRSDVRAILSSGYDEQSATRRFAGKGLAGFLQKPYTYDRLMKACQAALQGSSDQLTGV